MFSTEVVTPWPSRGLFCSVLAHLLFLVVSLFVPWNYWLPTAYLIPMQSQVREQELLLPDLAPMGAASKPAPAPGKKADSGPAPKKSAEPETAKSPSAATEAVRGVVSPAPQIIVSSQPHSDNALQTILQPDLVKPPKLPKPLPIPPMVSLAAATPQLVAPPVPKPVSEPPKPVAVLPLSVKQDLPAVEAPKLPLPPSGEQEKALNNMASAPVPAGLPKLGRSQVGVPEDAATGTHNVLVVDAVPMPTGKPAEIPPGELHGAFTVSPSGTYSPAPSTVAGGGTAPTGAPGVGSAAGTATGTATPGTSTGAGTATAGAGAGTGVGHGTGTGLAAGTGLGSGGTGGGTSAGSGSGLGAGTGAGTGTGSSPFGGIAIQGGSSSGGRTQASVPANPKPRASYEFSIVANGASGGAFKDYGIFTDRASYTVYLDMSDAGTRSSWPLQYAVDTSRDPNSSEPPVPTLGTLEPPYAITKALPVITPESAQRGEGIRVVVFGVINRSGQWEKLRILQGADSNVNRLVLEALDKWTFEPAKMYGRPVPVKCLLGVPVSSLPIQ